MPLGTEGVQESLPFQYSNCLPGQPCSATELLGELGHARYPLVRPVRAVSNPIPDRCHDACDRLTRRTPAGPPLALALTPSREDLRSCRRVQRIDDHRPAPPPRNTDQEPAFPQRPAGLIDYRAADPEFLHKKPARRKHRAHRIRAVLYAAGDHGSDPGRQQLLALRGHRRKIRSAHDAPPGRRASRTVKMACSVREPPEA